MNKSYFFTAAMLTICTCVCLSCARKPEKHGDGELVEMRHARNITMRALGDSVTIVQLVNPWDSTQTLAKYLLVERGYSATESLPKDAAIIEVPVERSIVYAGVHASLISELGASQSIAGVCDAEYMKVPYVKNGLSDGTVADCGLSSAPVMEKIIELRPDAILLSPYENSDETARFSRIGATTVLTADYMESTPLGRAEWIKFYGRLFGKGEQADSLFAAVETEYDKWKAIASRGNGKPSVLFDRPYSGIWDVPTSGSVTGIIIEDAGGSNPFDSYSQGGSAHLSPEEVIHTARNADIWLIRHFEPNLSMHDLARDNSLYTKIKAYKTGNVLFANTMETTLFDDGAFHPDKVLSEMVRLIHPELCEEGDSLVYYKKLK